MLRRSHYIALGLVGLLTLVVLNLPTHTAGRIKLAIGSVFLPFFGLSRTTQQLTGEAADALVPRSELLRQLDQLRRTNQQLQISALQAEALLRENNQLRQLVGWQQKQGLRKLKLANVIARDPANWWQTVQIDLGSREGMRVDLAVITTNGLVGRVSAVFLTHSRVELISNPTCKVSAVIDKTRETGVISGSSGPLDNSLVTLSFLSSNSSLKPGQSVLTSGLGGIFPKDIPIGQVAEDSRPVEFGLYTEARVKLAANLSALEEVWVVLP
jgi:rod shape-determining protein MreC